MDREWEPLLPLGPWLVAVISWRCRCRAHCAGLCQERQKCHLEKTAPDLKTPRHNVAHFCCAKFCHSRFRPFQPPAGTCGMEHGRRKHKLRRAMESYLGIRPDPRGYMHPDTCKQARMCARGLSLGAQVPDLSAARPSHKS